VEVIIRGDGLKVTEALEDYAKQRLDRLDRYLPNISDVRVDLAHQHTRRGEDVIIAQITVRHQRGAILRAEEKAAGDIHLAINAAVDKMYRQIQRFKGKRRRKGRERFTATLDELDVAEAIPGIDEFVEEYEERPGIEAAEAPIARRKQIAVTAMNEAEAIEQMELLGHNFFVFFNDATSGINILYRRAEGGYGVLVPHVE
jgi:putative sigma-54 modulation protein